MQDLSARLVTYMPYCFVYATTHMVTIQNPQKYSKLVLSPQTLVNLHCQNRIRDCLVNQGLHNIQGQQFLRMQISNLEQVKGKKYRIISLKAYHRGYEIRYALINNFCRGNPVYSYSIPGRYNMFDFSNEDASEASQTNPFIRKSPLKNGQDPRPHAVLIIGIHIVSVHPLKMSVQFKKILWCKMGYTRRRIGCTWVTSDFFECIFLKR
ncbi:hypothetical protein Hanom_Chr04g00372431 [Helianthus anomalus]